VSIAVVQDANSTTQVIEDSVPATWGASSIRNISGGGSFDSVNNKVKWVFLNNGVSQVLTYVITPPSDATGVQTFSGLANFGAANVVTGGDDTISLGSAPSGTPVLKTPIGLTIAGRKKTVTDKASVAVRGLTTGTVTQVTYRVGKKGSFKVATGTANWKFKAKLKPGKNIVTVMALGLDGSSSSSHVTIIRR
jgi:hypothetical protein